MVAGLSGSAYRRTDDRDHDVKFSSDIIYDRAYRSHPYHDLVVSKSECLAQCAAASGTNAKPDAHCLPRNTKIPNQNNGMEGPQNLKPDQSSKSKQIILISIIILFHLVGITGLAIPATRPVFLQIVPWHILLMFLVIIISYEPLLNSCFLLFALIIFITGYCAEWIGIHKHWIFGNYTYGKALGLKFDQIPLIIGINWLLLIYSSGVLMQRIRIRSIFIRVIIGSIILVLLDLLIEPVAIKFDYWDWINNIIPLKNYAGWFLMSCMMLLVFEKFNFKKQSIVAPVLLLTQFVFFAILNIL